MQEEQIREALNAHWQASAAGDANAEHDIYDDDAICDYPYAPLVQCLSCTLAQFKLSTALDTNRLLRGNQLNSKRPPIFQTGRCLYEGIGDTIVQLIQAGISGLITLSSLRPR
jgi:hypothetical protein